MTTTQTRTLQEFADFYMALKARGAGPEALKVERSRTRAAARLELQPGEVRTLTVGHVTAKVEQVEQGWAVEVEQYGEVLNALSGTWTSEHDALRSFTATVLLLIG